MPSMTVTDLTEWMRCRASHESGHAAVGLTTTHGPLTFGSGKKLLTATDRGRLSTYPSTCSPTYHACVPDRAPGKSRYRIGWWRHVRPGWRPPVGPNRQDERVQTALVSRQLGLLRYLEPSSLKPRACRSIGWSARLRWTKIRSATILAVCNKAPRNPSDS